MKKLMIAAAMVCAAAIAQAGYVQWGATSVKQGDTALTSGHIYAFFYAEETAANTARGKFTVDNIAKDTFTGLLDNAAWDDTKKATAAGTFSVGTAAAQGGYTKAQLNNSEFGLTGGTTYYGYLVITDSEEITDKTKFIVSAVKSAKTAGDGVDQGTTFSFGSQASATWYSVAPEPTTGLLMLFGLGALALKRRRA